MRGAEKFGLCILLVAAVSFGNECTDPYAHLNPHQRRVLDRATPPHAVTLLTGEVNGIPRTLVILGEVHVQSAEDVRVGRAVIDAFPERAVEGFPGSPFWKAFRSLAYFVEGLFSGRSAGSLITESRRHEALAKKAAKVAERYKLSEKAPEELDRFRYRYGGMVLSGRDVLKLAGIADRVGNLNLEKDYRPGPGDRAAAWGITGVYLADRLWFLPALGSLPAWLSEHPYLSGTLGAVSIASFITTTMVKIHWSDNGVAPAMSKRREAAMGKAVLDHFRGGNDRQVLLMIVGRNHVRGIHDLMEKEGFSWQSIPRPSSASR